MCGPWVEKIPWRRAWLPTPVFLPGKFHGQRSLAGYSSQSPKESDTTEQLSTHSILWLHRDDPWNSVSVNIFQFYDDVKKSTYFEYWPFSQLAISRTLLWCWAGIVAELPVSCTITRVNNGYTYNHSVPTKPSLFQFQHRVQWITWYIKLFILK